MEKWTNLGVANGWLKTPEELEKCQELGHTLKEKDHDRWNCYHHVRCDICKIKYSYDSSG